MTRGNREVVLRLTLNQASVLLHSVKEERERATQWEDDPRLTSLAPPVPVESLDGVLSVLRAAIKEW